MNERHDMRSPSIGVERYTDAFLEDLRGVGDQGADAAVAVFFETIEQKDGGLFPMLVRTTHGELDDEQAPGVGPFVELDEPWPEWVQPELIRRGQKVFGDWGLQLSSGLFMASLPMSYTAAKGAVPLVRTARLTSNPKRRYLETGQMIIDAMTPGALEPGKKGYRAVRHVRLMHAAVRYTLLHPEILPAGTPAQQPWDPSLGVPLNQEDLLGCLFAFNVIGLKSLEKAGVKLSDDDQEAYVHVWNLVGHQIGVRRDLLPLNHVDAKIVAERILKRQTAKSEAGSELTATAIEAMQDLLKSKSLKGLPASGIRYYLGDEVADLLDVPASDWTRSIFVTMRRIDSVLYRLLSWLPGQHSISSSLGRRMVAGFEEAERGRDRPKFEISDELREAWGISPVVT